MSSRRPPGSVQSLAVRLLDGRVLVPVAFLLVAVAEGLAIAWRSPGLGVVAILWYGIAFLAVLIAYGWRGAMLALLVTLPLVTIEVGFGNTERTLSADKLALAIVATAWLLRRAPLVLPRLAMTPAVGAWTAFLGIVVLSSAREGLTLAQGWDVLRAAAYAAIFLVALDAFADRATRRRAFELAGRAAAVVASISLIEWAARASGRPAVFYLKQGTMDDTPVAGGTFGHVNFLGAYLVLLLPVLAARWAAARGRGRALALLPIVLAVPALLYARSMGAWLGLAAGGAIFAWATATGYFDRRLKRLTLVATLALAVLAAAIVAVKTEHNPASFGVRIAAYRIGLAAVADRPLLGHGTDSFSRLYYLYEHQVYGRPLGEFHVGGAKLSAHSSFLDVAVDRGLLGLAAFVALLGVIVAAGYRACMRTRSGEDRLVLAGALAGVLGFVAQAFTENLFEFSKVAAIFWIMAAALVRLSEADAGPPSG